MKNPIQPLAKDALGVLRFKSNAIVTHLLDWATERGHGLNELAALDFTADDRQQLAQLIGYSLSGYGDLACYVDDDAFNAASKMVDDGLSEDKARISAQQEELEAVRTGLLPAVSRLYGVHPDNLMCE